MAAPTEANTPADPDFERRVRRSFARQAFMTHLGATLPRVAPGAVDITMGFDSRLTQQHGYFHAGTTTTIADSAAGYAALTLYPKGTGVLTTEFKINLLRPAAGERLLARGRVLKPGRTLTVCQSDVYAMTGSKEVHIATGFFSMMCLEGLAD